HVGPARGAHQGAAFAAAVGPTERRLVLREQLVDGLDEPRIMAELEGMAMTPWRGGQEVAQPRQIAGEVRRELPENRPEAVAEVGNAVEEPIEWLDGVGEALQVGDEAVSFDGEVETVRHLLAPVGEVLRR